MPFKDPEKLRAYKAEWTKKKYHSAKEHTEQKLAKAKSDRKDPNSAEYRWRRAEENRAKDRERDRARRTDPAWKRAHRGRYIKRTYGITMEELEALLVSQNHQCGICKCPVDCIVSNIDHCHKTGKVRGVLCLKCNSGIGLLQDSIEVVAAALHYLKSHQ